MVREETEVVHNVSISMRDGRKQPWEPLRAGIQMVVIFKHSISFIFKRKHTFVRV